MEGLLLMAHEPQRAVRKKCGCRLKEENVVICKGKSCSTCGWNSTVALHRKDRIRYFKGLKLMTGTQRRAMMYRYGLKGSASKVYYLPIKKPEDTI